MSDNKNSKILIIACVLMDILFSLSWQVLCNIIILFKNKFDKI